LDFPVDERLIVGADTADDAGVFRLDDNNGLVLTVDFFTPIVDDPYKFGAIAAANSLSDVYAMGGRPLAGLNICCFDPKGDKDMQRQILQGGADKLYEAGAVMAGGHSVRDNDTKYGLAIIGHVRPDKVKSNAGALPGQKLVFTKPIGTGLLSTARRKDAISEEDFLAAVDLMMELNRTASETMVEEGCTGCTDVTGFGLLGHAREMACASNVALAIDVLKVPLLPRAKECADKGFVPGGAHSNRSHFGPFVDGGPPEESWWPILFDPQTSGGLLFSIAAERSGDVLEKLKAKNVNAAIIGEVLDGPAGRISLRT
jgi:selenide,water dikinase